MTSFFYNKIGEYFGHHGKECPKGDEIADFEPGALANFGVTWVTFFDQLLIPEEIRDARGAFRSPCLGNSPLCPPFPKRPNRRNCDEYRFPKSSCP
ncbi:hypothetical protein WA026_001124 [Henosepilachna vigintioctopunctata]|uniref:Uncharacterized protein n=1 Tax=Henosepilachna vigintioctopunctata TaxID=420089 RepID=A0AAW1V9D1_9CUCU